ncbi:MAG: hypothetical protein FD121_1665, partial [Gallionellaceae bacterium]
MSQHARHRIIYLHGFEGHGIGYTMPQLENLIRQTVPGANNDSLVEHWSPLKNTKEFTFVEVAEQLASDIRNGGAYEKQYAVCHSMGGIIARQLCVLGIHFDGVLTIGSPHIGTAWWINGGNWFSGRGPMSIADYSEDLKRLNRSDAAHAHKYSFVGIACYGKAPGVFQPAKPHQNDTISELFSQFGGGTVGSRNTYELTVDYG